MIVTDSLILRIADFDVNVLTGIYSEETKLPQPLRISIAATMNPPAHYAPDTPLSASKNYMDLKNAASTALPKGVHFTLVEAVADHIITTLFAEDERITHIEVNIIKLAIAENGEAIGITLSRSRKDR